MSRLGTNSDCCKAPTVQDSTGDVICIVCGTIQDNYPDEEEEKTK